MKTTTSYKVCDITMTNGSLIVIVFEEPKLVILWFWNIFKTKMGGFLKIQ